MYVTKEMNEWPQQPFVFLDDATNVVPEVISVVIVKRINKILNGFNRKFAQQVEKTPFEYHWR